MTHLFEDAPCRFILHIYMYIGVKPVDFVTIRDVVLKCPFGALMLMRIFSMLREYILFAFTNLSIFIP